MTQMPSLAKGHIQVRDNHHALSINIVLTLKITIMLHIYYDTLVPRES